MGETTWILNTLFLRRLVGHTFCPIAFLLGVGVMTFYSPMACKACMLVCDTTFYVVLAVVAVPLVIMLTDSNLILAVTAAWILQCPLSESLPYSVYLC